jgi:hypothetical protein
MLYPAELRARRRRFPRRMNAPAQARCDIDGVVLRQAMKSLAFTSICILASGCTAPANPPSLLPRAIETRSDAEAAPSAITVPNEISPALSAELNALLIDARAGDADFAKAQSAGNAALVSGKSASAGSEAWIAAQLVLSALQVARQRSANALAKIDTIAINQSELASRNATVGGLSEILAVQAEIELIVARQTARLDELTR